MKLVVKAVLFAVCLSGVSAFAADPGAYPVVAGDKNFQSIPACGGSARAKAVYAKDTGVLTLRVCDNTLCAYPIWINTNAKYEKKDETTKFSSVNDPRIKKVNAQCSDFPLDYRVKSDQKNIRAVLGGGFFSSFAKIDITLE